MTPRIESLAVANKIRPMIYLIESEELFLGLLFEIVESGREDVLAFVDVLDQVQLVSFQLLLELGEDRSAIAVASLSSRALKFSLKKVNRRQILVLLSNTSH